MKGFCTECGKRVTVVERAAGGYVEVFTNPSPAGTMMRLASGVDAGKFVELGGTLLSEARATSQVYELHACGAPGLFDG